MQAFCNDRSVKVFAAALTYLAKCGKDISLEATTEGIVLRTLNDAKSAFAAVHLQRDFFTDYIAPDPNEDGVQVAKCKFVAKAGLQVFRSLRNVESMRLYFSSSGGSHFLVVQFTCKHGDLYYEDEDVMQAVFDRDQAAHYIFSRPGMLSRLADHMRGVEEVSLIADPMRITLQSYNNLGDASTVHSALQTSMTVPAGEFDAAHISIDPADLPPGGLPELEAMVAADASGAGGDAGSLMPTYDVTFSVKEFKALLSFAEAPAVTSDEVALFFTSFGQPILISTQGAVSRPFRADLLLASVEKRVHRFGSSSASSAPTTTAGALAGAATGDGAAAAAGGAGKVRAAAEGESIAAADATSAGAAARSRQPAGVVETPGARKVPAAPVSDGIAIKRDPGDVVAGGRATAGSGQAPAATGSSRGGGAPFTSPLSRVAGDISSIPHIDSVRSKATGNTSHAGANLIDSGRSKATASSVRLMETTDDAEDGDDHAMAHAPAAGGTHAASNRQRISIGASTIAAHAEASSGKMATMDSGRTTARSAPAGDGGAGDSSCVRRHVDQLFGADDRSGAGDADAGEGAGVDAGDGAAVDDYKTPRGVAPRRVISIGESTRRAARAAAQEQAAEEDTAPAVTAFDSTAFAAAAAAGRRRAAGTGSGAAQHGVVATTMDPRASISPVSIAYDRRPSVATHGGAAAAHVDPLADKRRISLGMDDGPQYSPFELADDEAAADVDASHDFDEEAGDEYAASEHDEDMGHVHAAGRGVHDNARGGYGRTTGAAPAVRSAVTAAHAAQRSTVSRRSVAVFTQDSVL